MLAKRSEQKELIDLGPDYYTYEEYHHCLKMLFHVNKLLGFFRDTVRLLKKFSPQSSVLDIGCGGGLFLLHLGQYFPEMKLTGIDIAADAIQIAKQAAKNFTNSKVNFQLQTKLTKNADIILATLVCHHLTDAELIIFLSEMYAKANKAVIINDLHRHRFPLLFYKIFSPILFRNRLITHDGLISIKRGFTRPEWLRLLKAANITHYQLKWRFPFRWQLILWKK